MQRKFWVLATLCLAGCQGMPATRPAPAPQRNEAPSDDRETVAAVTMADTFQSMERLAQAAPAEQAELLSAARNDYQRAPQGGAQLRYALLLATPGNGARDPAMAQTLLRELAAQPETLVPLQRAVVLLELSKLDRELDLKADNDRLQSEAQRSDKEKFTSLQRRLQTEADENNKLRKQLEEAQAKLDAIADIERNLTERKSGTEGRQP